MTPIDAATVFMATLSKMTPEDREELESILVSGYEELDDQGEDLDDQVDDLDDQGEDLDDQVDERRPEDTEPDEAANWNK